MKIMNFLGYTLNLYKNKGKNENSSNWNKKNNETPGVLIGEIVSMHSHCKEREDIFSMSNYTESQQKHLHTIFAWTVLLKQPIISHIKQYSAWFILNIFPYKLLYFKALN